MISPPQHHRPTPYLPNFHTPSAQPAIAHRPGIHALGRVEAIPALGGIGSGEYLLAPAVVDGELVAAEVAGDAGAEDIVGAVAVGRESIGDEDPAAAVAKIEQERVAHLAAIVTGDHAVGPRCFSPPRSRPKRWLLLSPDPGRVAQREVGCLHLSV